MKQGQRKNRPRKKEKSEETWMLEFERVKEQVEKWTSRGLDIGVE